MEQAGQAASADDARERVFWRVEGSLLNLTAVRPVGFFAWNSQTFLQRWMRRGSMAFLAIARPFLYATNRVFATRLLRSFLFEVDPLDPTVIALAAVSIFLVALAASFIPARRAAAIEPMQALRME